jgi:hypothetical protein
MFVIIECHIINMAIGPYVELECIHLLHLRDLISRVEYSYPAILCPTYYSVSV